MAKMKKPESEALAKRIVHFYTNDGGRDVKLTCRHFMAEGIARTTIKDIIGRYEERGTVVHETSGGRPRSVATVKVVNAISRLIEKDPNISVRNGARKLGLSKTTYDRVKAHELGIKAYKKEVAPNYKDGQKERAKTACRKIYRKRLLSGELKILIMDDETYVPVDCNQVPGLEFYHSQSRGEVPDANRFKTKEKFPKKYLVWQCIDELGNVSDPFICKGTMTGEIYLKECLQKRLMPFIKQHHQGHKILFWMDMASIHFKKEVVEWLKAQNIDFIEKEKTHQMSRRLGQSKNFGPYAKPSISYGSRVQNHSIRSSVSGKICRSKWLKKVHKS